MTSRIYFVLLFVCILLYSCDNVKKEKATDKEREEYRQLAEMDSRELENQYSQFATQYNEMKRVVKDDSLAKKLQREQERAEGFLQQLRDLKSDNKMNVAEILRLKKELETVRVVLRSYVRQVDSLQQLNQTLYTERDAARADAERAQQKASGLAKVNQELNKTVEIAAQLNATNITMQAIKANGKLAKRIKDVKSIGVIFSISRNATAPTGRRNVYVRILKPNLSVLAAMGKTRYENTEIDYSAVKSIEYNGEEQQLSIFVPITEYIGEGNYTVHILCDGHIIGTNKMRL